jgi:ABC-2 type transport system permease protein
MNDVYHAEPPARPALLFQRLRWHLLRNAAAAVWHGSAVRLVSMVLCSLLVWGFVFAVSQWGFGFLSQQKLMPPELLDRIIATLFDLFFLALELMLIFSTGIILYGSLFTAPEAAFLLSTPARDDRVFAYKYQGALVFSSWAFLLLGSPILIAYGLVFEAAWPFYALLPLYMLGFILLPGAVGAVGCLLIVNLVPRRRRQVLVGAILLIVVLVFAWAFQVARTMQTENWRRDAAIALLNQFAFAQGQLMPSHWLVRGLLAARVGKFEDAAFRLALLWSNGLFLYVAAAWLAARLYRRAYNRVRTGGTLRRRYGGLWLDRALSGLLFFLSPPVRLLIVKDFRTFRRDPSQWAQIVIFAGLLLLYFINTNRFYEESIPWEFKSGVSLLNLSGISVLLCAWTGRFVYPLLSLEGRKFWILGLLPLRRDQLLWGKFAFSATGAVLFAEMLVMLSDLMLGMPALAMGLHALTVAVLAVGLSGLSVGIGAWVPNFRETDPSKIAIGFGGTLNLIVSLLFLVLVIVFMSLPWHVAAVQFHSGDETARLFSGGMAVGLAVGAVLGVLAVAVPLRVGARTLRRMEF